MDSAPEPAFDRLLRGDRIAIAAGLAGLALAAWAWTIYLSHHMPGMASPGMSMPGMDMPGMDMSGMHMPAPAWGLAEYLWLTGMWAIMMVAMMSPTAAPAILLFAKMSRQQPASSGLASPTAGFVGGYFAIWTLFSVGAALLQLVLHRALLLTAMGASTSQALGAGLLIAAGLYQWSSIKHRCLSACQSPLGFLTARWRPGIGGAFRMGVSHGLNCVACCWLVMLLLFVAGVMNLLWVAALSVVVLLERIVPRGRLIARLSGGGFLLAGIWMLVR
jgi:predicted metal-binding membrane protein